jgi:hypothetical protein
LSRQRRRQAGVGDSHIDDRCLLRNCQFDRNVSVTWLAVSCGAPSVLTWPAGRYSDGAEGVRGLRSCRSAPAPQTHRTLSISVIGQQRSGRRPWQPSCL